MNKEHPKGLEVVGHVQGEKHRDGISRSQAQLNCLLPQGTELVTLTNAKAYAEQRVKEAIEECAKLCDRISNALDDPASVCAEAIRALGEKK